MCNVTLSFYFSDSHESHHNISTSDGLTQSAAIVSCYYPTDGDVNIWTWRHVTLMPLI